MNVILILIIVSLGIALFFLGGFIWSVRSGQFDDTCTPSMRLLTDDEPEHSHRRNSAASPFTDSTKTTKTP
jgi:cbb3-type cytochrome oxidase maturation protein